MIDEINKKFFTQTLNDWALKFVGTIHARRNVSQYEKVEIDSLIGQTIRHIGFDQWSLQFVTDEFSYLLKHNQECCENVYIEDITGDMSDLIDQIIMKAECREDSGWKAEVREQHTYTFYHLATVKGYVDIRFNGISNGNYSTSVDIIRKTISD